MSHFTNIETHFKNLISLEKTLNRLNITYKREKTSNKNACLNSSVANIDLRIPQSNGHDIIFSWNGKEYELIVDKSFWKQTSSVESFIDKIAQKYAGEVIINESQKIGFQPIQYQQNADGSNTLILERYNINSH